MATPVILKEVKKSAAKAKWATESECSEKTNLRPHVAELIKKIVNENAPTWQALAKR